jgi:general secretion pathway protein D
MRAACLALLLAGCASNTYNLEGMNLLEQGKYEEGLAVFEAASRDAPDDIAVRRDLIWARESAINGLVADGDAARTAGKYDTAERAYRRALRIVPGDPRVVSRLNLIAGDRRHAELVAKARNLFAKRDLKGATRLLKNIFLENPNDGEALELQRKINETEARQLTAEPELASTFKNPVSLQFRDANLKMVFESISKTSGLNILLDKDVRGEQRTSLFVKNTSVQDAIDLILMQNHLNEKVLSKNTIYVYPAVASKEKEFEDLKVRSFHLVHADAKQMMTVIKTMLKTKDILVNEKTNSLIMRDTPDAIRLAEKLVADQDIPDPEVMLQVEVLEVTHSLLSDLGIQYPGSVTLSPSVPGGGNLTLGNIHSAFKRDNVIVTPVPTLSFNASLTDGNTKILASPSIRVRNKEKAKIHIGDRLPVFTNSVTPLSTGAAVTTGSVQYVETGIKLEAEPTIYPNGEISIKLGLEVSVAQAAVTNPQSGTTAYPISTRTTSTVLQLKDGETNVIAGLIKDTEAKSRIMVPGLGEIPGLGRLFGTHHTDGGRTEIILSITPKLVGASSIPSAHNMEFWSGTESQPRSKPFVLSDTGSVDMSAEAAAPRGRPGTPGARPGGNQPQAMSFLWLGPTQAKVGGRFAVTLNARTGEPVHGMDLTVGYDPSLLKAVDAVGGTFLRQGGPGSSFTKQIDEGSGQVSISAADAGGRGSRGGGTVATITFQALAPGQAQISVGQLTPSSPSGEAVNFDPPAAHTVTLVK